MLDAPDVVANINSLRRAAEKLAKTGKPVSFYHEQLGMEVMVTGVRVDSVELMRITLFAHEHPFDELDYAFAADLSALLGRLFGDSGFYRQNRGRTISYFLKELFSESRPNLTNLLERLQRCGYRLRDQFRVMSVWPDPSSPPEPAKLEALAEQLSHYLVGHMYAVLENHVVLLLNYEAGKDLDESALRSIRHILHANHAHAGISNLFQDLLDAKQYAWQAEEALSVWLNGQSGVEEKVTFFSEVAYRSIFEICRQQVSLVGFCDPALLELMRIDQRDGSHLTVTLYQYLQHGCNAPRTAQLLFIHKNTMLYRLEKIRAILGADLTDGDVLFRLQLSYRILIYFGYFNEKS